MSGSLPGAGQDMSDVASRFWGHVAAEANIAPIVESNRSDGQILFEVQNMKFWSFSATSSASPSAGSVVKPDDVDVSDPGRWLAPVTSTPAANYRTGIARYQHQGDGAASSAIGETPFFRAQSAVTVVGAYADVGGSGVTADNTNYATWTVARRASGGGSKATVVQATTQASGLGNVTAFAPISLGSVSNTALAAGESLTFEQAKAASGVQIPAGSIFVPYLIT